MAYQGQICIIALDANQSGGEGVYTSQLVRQLSSRGYSIQLICHEADSDIDAICKVQRLVRPSFSPLPFAWRLEPLYNLYYYRSIARTHAIEKPSLIIGSAQYLTWAYSRVVDAPLLYLPHSLVAAHEVNGYPWASPLQRMLATKVIDYLEYWLLRRATRTIRFTHTGCDELISHYGARVRPRFEVFSPAVRIPSIFTEQSMSGPLRLLFVGRLVQSKNVDFLLSSLRNLRDLDWRLDIVGDGGERKRLESIAREYELADRVTFRGYSADVSKWYMSADVLTFPSRLESFGLVILEAMSYGVPAVTIRADGKNYFNSYHEFITDGEDGFIVNSEPDFVHRLATLIRDRNALAGIGARARQKVEKHYSWDDHINHYERLFAELAPESGAALLKRRLS